MTTPIDAAFDGTVFRPIGPVPLAPNTQIRLHFETVQDSPPEPASFLKAAQSLDLQGPPDWATNLDKYLYDE